MRQQRRRCGSYQWWRMPDGEVLETYADRYLVVYDSVDDRCEQGKRDDFGKFHEGDPEIRAQ